jgi:uncharacterized membrane protein
LAWLQRPPVAELLVMAIAAACRLWRLDYHSFWFDEAVSLDWAGSSAGFIWESTLPLIKDKHPPVYYLLLMSWRALLDAVGLGNNDGAIRLLGALLGIATAGGVLLLVRRLSGRKTALLAALLVGLSPALVWYAQELRMFQPAATFLIWALYALLRAWPPAVGLVGGNGSALAGGALQLSFQRLSFAGRRAGAAGAAGRSVAPER